MICVVLVLIYLVIMMARPIHIAPPPYRMPAAPLFLPCGGGGGNVMRNKKRMLVIGVHGGHTGYDYAAEWSNINYFLRYGVDTSRADYFFILPVSRAEWWPEQYRNVTDSGGRRVVTFMRSHRDCPCDLCAHSVVMGSLTTRLGTEYGTVTMFNTGARGPFPASTDWMQRIREHTEDESTPTAVVVSFVWESSCTFGSYFVAIPACAAHAVNGLWHETCHDEGNMNDCSVRGEFTLLPYLNWLGVPVYSTSQGITISNESDCAAHEPDAWPWFMWGRYTNPDFWPVNLTEAMFVKYGGGIYRKRWVDQSVVRDVQRSLW